MKINPSQQIVEAIVLEVLKTKPRSLRRCYAEIVKRLHDQNYHVDSANMKSTVFKLVDREQFLFLYKHSNRRIQIRTYLSKIGVK